MSNKSEKLTNKKEIFLGDARLPTTLDDPTSLDILVFGHRLGMLISFLKQGFQQFGDAWDFSSFLWTSWDIIKCAFRLNKFKGFLILQNHWCSGPYYEIFLSYMM